MKKNNIYILILIYFCTISAISAQVAENPFSVSFSSTQITEQNPFTVSVRVTGLEQIPQISFPDIKNFQKRETSRSSLTNKVGATTVIVYTISQNYYPKKTGILNTGALEIVVNKQILRSEGAIVTVNQGDEAQEEVEITDNMAVELENEASQKVFLAIRTDKKRIYVREGFNLKLSLLVSEGYTAEMDFYEVEKQLERILKALKPASCWEENFGIQEIPAIPIIIGGKNFTEYRIYQASFFPLNNQPITIPAVKWVMKVKKKTGENVSTPILETFISKPLAIAVVNLPAHPLSSQVSIGDFKLEEKISNNILETGKSYRYDFKVMGEGNVQSIREPIFVNNALFDIYPPDIENNVMRGKGKIIGEKIFRYQIIPKQNGVFKLKQLVYWVYFNPKKEIYDTLHSSLKLTISGANIQNTQLSSIDTESIYTDIARWDSTKLVIDYQTIIRNIANVLVMIMLLGMIFIFRK